MDLAQTEYSDLLMVSVGLIAVLLSIGVVALFRDAITASILALQATLSGARREALHGLREASGSIRVLGEQLEQLDSISADYHSVFHEAGWAELIEINTSLCAAEEALKLLIKGNRFDDAAGLSGLIMSQLPPELEQIAVERFPEFSHLKGWQDRSLDLLETLYSRIAAASEEGRAIGRFGEPTRRATTQTLAQLRQFLDSGS